MISALPLLGHVALGIFGGAGFTALWELWLKPRRQRRSTAEGLLIEIRTNAARVQDELRIVEQSNVVTPTFHLSTLFYRAIADRISNLPTTVSVEVALVYRDFDELNAESQLHADWSRELRTITGPSATLLFQNVSALEKQFRCNLSTVLNRAERMLPALTAICRKSHPAAVTRAAAPAVR